MPWTDFQPFLVGFTLPSQHPAFVLIKDRLCDAALVGRLEAAMLAADPAGQDGAASGRLCLDVFFVILRCMFTLKSQFMVLMLAAGSLGERLLHGIISLKGCSQA